MKKKYWLMLVAIFSIIIFFLAISAIILLSSIKIMPNTYINGINIGNLTKEEAMVKLEEIYGDKVQDTYISLIYNDKIWDITPKDLELKYNIKEAIEEAYKISRSGNIIARYLDSINARFTDRYIALKISYNEKSIIEKIDMIAEDIDKDFIDATIGIDEGKIIITPDTNGLRLKKSDSIELVKGSIESYDMSDIQLPVDIIEAQVKKSDLEHIKDRLGEYTTRFDASNINRSFNIALATKSASGIILKPGEVFSLNSVIGTKLSEKGYKIAKVIINNEYVDGIGGGLCQVSTTLYNAALLSNLKIVERRNHSIPSAYVGLGRDATLSGDYIDMKFENNNNYSIYIYGEVKGNRVTYSIYGKKDKPGRSIEIRTSVIKRIEPETKIIYDETLPYGVEEVEKEARTGYIVKSYRVILENGKEIFVEPLYTDTYRVSDEVKRVGVKPLDETQGLEELNLDEGLSIDKKLSIDDSIDMVRD